MGLTLLIWTCTMGRTKFLSNAPSRLDLAGAFLLILLVEREPIGVAPVRVLKPEHERDDQTSHHVLSSFHRLSPPFSEYRPTSSAGSYG